MGSKQPLENEGSFREIVKTHRPRKIDLVSGQHLKERDRQEEPGNVSFCILTQADLTEPLS